MVFGRRRFMYLNRNIKNKTLIIALVLLDVISVTSFIVTPFTGDLKVFTASANQSSYISRNLIVGAYRAWELKSVFSRTLIYFIYKLAVLFVPFGTYSFEVCFKIIYAIIIGCVSYLSVYLALGKGKEKIPYWLGLLAAFFSLHSGCQMQVEMTCSLIIILAFSLYYNAIKTDRLYFLKLFLAGMLIGSTFYFKSVLIILSVSVVAAICIFNTRNNVELSIKRMMIVVLGSICLLVINYLVIMAINPEEINDIIYASAFQETLLSNGTGLRDVPYIAWRFVGEFVGKSRFVPIAAMGVIAFIINFIDNSISKRWKLVFFHTVMWLMPATFVALSNKYFIYHFVPFLFPSIIELYCCFVSKRKTKQMVIIATSAYAMIFYLCNFSFLSKSVQKYIEYDKSVYAEFNTVMSEMNFDVSETVMYLDDGKGAYMLGNPSYLKYYFPLPLQRLDDSSTLLCHTQTKEKALSYSGKYISVFEDWFFGEKNKDIKDKIDREYELIGRYPVFSPPHSLNIDDIAIRYFDLYERR